MPIQIDDESLFRYHNPSESLLDSAPKYPGAPLAFHRTAQLPALALTVGANHPPPAHHDLAARYDDAFVSVGVFDVFLFHADTVSVHYGQTWRYRDRRSQERSLPFDHNTSGRTHPAQPFRLRISIFHYFHPLPSHY